MLERFNIETIWNTVPEAEIRSPEEVEDWAYIIGGLSSLFFSTYYVNLEKNTFRAVTQLNRVGDVLGDEVNFTAGLMLYANHFVHPDDRAGYLRVMNVENLRNSLHWWQPTVAVEYRKLDENPGAPADSWRWVRATMVLSRTGADEKPMTAVYAAQDITGGRRECAAGTEDSEHG